MLTRFPFARKRKTPDAGDVAEEAAVARENDAATAEKLAEAPQVRDITLGAARYRLHKYQATHGLMVMRAVEASIAAEVSGKVAFDSKMIAQIVAYVEALTPAGNVALNTLQAVDQFVLGWQDLEHLAIAMLGFNGIDYSALREAAEKRMWQEVGVDVAIGFSAAIKQSDLSKMQDMIEKYKANGAQ